MGRAPGPCFAGGVMDAPAASLTTRLYQLASNLLWTWEPEVIGIFRDLDPDLWRQVNHNPVALLAALPAEQLVRRAVETVCGQGYVQQRVDAQGWQHESYGHVDLELLPPRRAVGAGDQPLTVELPIGGQSLRVAAWRAQAGRATLLLLDSDVDGNPPGLRLLTAQLYGGDLVTRLRQELILGIGGVRMLDALGIHPGVLHLNEGHSAFAPVELARHWAAAQGVAFAAAHREVALRTVFTTHTPVAAGHDYFPPELVLEHLDWLVGETGMSADDLLALGRVHPTDGREGFCMTVLALRSARYANAVSALHGHVTRRMWQSLWPGHAEAEVPIGHITNGIHTPSWLAPQMQIGYRYYLGTDWRERMCSADVWQRLADVDDEALWETHQVLKRQMLNYVARRRLAPGAPGTLAPAAQGPTL